MNHVEALFARLESRFNNQPSIRNSVLTSDGEIVQIEKDFWEKSAVLREHSQRSQSLKGLTFTKNVLSALITAHDTGFFPYGIGISYELLAAASELELKELISECFNNLLSVHAIDEAVDFPAELSIETVMRVFKVFLECPLRSVEVYEQQLSMIARHCANDQDVMTNALNFLKQHLERFRNINLEGIPVTFETQMVPAVIYKRMGRLQTAIVFESELKPVDLLGDRIAWEDIIGVQGFYLKYGTYLLYWCGNHVNYKNLQDDSAPVLAMTGCYIFISRKNFVFAVHKDARYYTISLWVNDEKFEVIYQSLDEITIVEFECVSRVLAVQLSDRKLLLFKFENGNLNLLGERGASGVIDVLLSEREMFYLWKDSAGLRIETHPHPVAPTGERNERIVVKSERSTILSSLVRSGDSYFLTRNARLELVTNFPFSEGKKTLLTEGELHAVSELCLSP